MRKKHRRLLQAAIGIAVAAVVAFLVVGGNGAGATPKNGSGKPSSDTTAPQPPSNADFSGNGANVHGPYDSTRDGSASQNGNGNGEANGKPCAGCVGKADNKNPPGQMPDGSDNNAGYECDRNNGIGKSNPAHTSCKPSTTPPTTPPTSPETTPPTSPETTPPTSPETTPPTSPETTPPTSPETTPPTSPPSTAPTSSSATVAPTETTAPPTSASSTAAALPAGLATTGASNVPALIAAGAVLLLLGGVVLIGSRRQAGHRR